jgi:hypothetical protein
MAASGVYFYRLLAADPTLTRKRIVLRLALGGRYSRVVLEAATEVRRAV